MQVHNITITNNTITPSYIKIGTEGSYGFEQLQLVYSGEWNDLAIRFIFVPVTGEPVYRMYLNAPMDIPSEVYAQNGNVKFAIEGYDGEKRIKTLVGILAVQSTLEDANTEAIEPTPTEMQQIYDYFVQILDIADTLENFETTSMRAPYIGANGNWYQYNGDSNEFVDTGIEAMGGTIYRGSISISDWQEIDGKFIYTVPVNIHHLSLNCFVLSFMRLDSDGVYKNIIYSYERQANGDIVFIADFPFMAKFVLQEGGE